MIRATRVRTSVVDRISVIAAVVCVFAFAIYLKVGPKITTNNMSPQTKIWVDPNTSGEAHTKIAPVSLILLPFLVLWFRQIEEAGSYTRLPRRYFKDVFLQSEHWFRPPPFAFPPARNQLFI